MSDKKFNAVDFIMNYECDLTTEEETIKGFQELINSGLVWSLQGHYGRMANYLIEEGYCTYPSEEAK